MEDKQILLVYEMLLAVICSLVDPPDDIEVVMVPQGDEIMFRITIHPADTAKLIGIDGRMARAIRLIVSASGMKMKKPLAPYCEHEGRLGNHWL